jgi:adenylate cyclase
VDLDLTPDMQVSHVHARITWEDDGFWIEDLGSRNGTWVNGAQIREKTRLMGTDRIQVGQTRIRLEGDPALLPAVSAITPSQARDAQPLSEFAPAVVIPPREQTSGELQTDGLDRAESGLVDQPDGIVASRIISGDHPSALILPASPEHQDEALEATRRRLIAFYNLGAALGGASNLDSMVTTIVKHLVEAIPGAHRGALLLRVGHKLLLKAHVPGGGDPGTSQSLATRAMENGEGFIWQDGLQEAPEPSESIIVSGTRSAMYAPMIWGGEALGVVCVDNISNSDAFDNDDLRLLMAMANHAAMFVKNQSLQQELRSEAALRSILLRQFSPRIAERLLQERGRLRLGGERASPVTILVSDVRGFTATSAQMDPDDVVQLLNAMYALFTPIIFKYEGTVDKFVGDSMLAVFGSPEPDEHQCENAVRAALDMQQAMQKLADIWRIRGMPVWETGIGIHTGEVVHGFIGSAERMEYTVIGDAVNRAARFCDGAGPGEVLISRTVYEHVYRLVHVSAKAVETKHPEVEPVLESFVVRGLRESQSNVSIGQHVSLT